MVARITMVGFGLLASSIAAAIKQAKLPTKIRAVSSPATLKRALAMNLFGREVVGHHLGLFADSLVLSASIPLADLSAEDLADRIVMLARLAGTLSGSFESAAPTVEAAASMSLDAGGFIAV